MSFIGCVNASISNSFDKADLKEEANALERQKETITPEEYQAVVRKQIDSVVKEQRELADAVNETYPDVPTMPKYTVEGILQDITPYQGATPPPQEESVAPPTIDDLAPLEVETPPLDSYLEEDFSEPETEEFSDSITLSDISVDTADSLDVTSKNLLKAALPSVFNENGNLKPLDQLSEEQVRKLAAVLGVKCK